MSADLLPVIDVDSHVTEPADVWTSRMSAKHLEQAPRVVADVATGLPRWQIGERLANFVCENDHAGWMEPYPSTPPDYSEADPGAWDPQVRLQRLDEYGINAQILFPNLVAFHAYAFMLLDRDAGIDAVRAYNDFLAEFAAADPKRLLPQISLPFWDMDAAMAEMRRCKELGFNGVNLGVQVHRLGLPKLSDEYWTPLLAQAQDFELPINFHVGSSTLTAEDIDLRDSEYKANMLSWAESTALLFIGNASGISDIIMSGVCHRFPRLNFVSVESGFGYIPFLLEALDWQFTAMSCQERHPDRLLPSEYFRRQVYATFWFETGIGRQVDLYPDNIMFETDYPHPTSLSPGPGTHAPAAQDAIRDNLADLTDEHLRKVLFETAARVYHVDLPSSPVRPGTAHAS